MYPDVVWISEQADMFASYVRTGTLSIPDHWVRDHVIYPHDMSTAKEALGEYCYGDNEFEK
ncbi:hypothetical protein KJ742_00050 [Patescibacteria group bacterium]|nr:hypothetical protein [Patescibacteria group bacterium]